MKRLLLHCPTFPDEFPRRTFEGAGYLAQLLGARITALAPQFIMEAYGHRRLREFIFGGVTEEIIKGCPLPVLLFS